MESIGNGGVVIRVKEICIGIPPIVFLPLNSIGDTGFARRSIKSDRVAGKKAQARDCHQKLRRQVHFIKTGTMEIVPVYDADKIL